METQKMDPLLEKIVADVEQKVTNRDAYERIVVAGMKLMFSKQTHEMMLDGIEEGEKLPPQVGKALVGVMVMLQKNARGTMPFDAMLPAAFTLMMHALDFLSQTGRLEITPEVISQATQSMVQELLRQIGVSEDQLVGLAEQASKAVADPAKADVIRQQFAGE